MSPRSHLSRTIDDREDSEMNHFASVKRSVNANAKNDVLGAEGRQIMKKAWEREQIHKRFKFHDFSKTKVTNKFLYLDKTQDPNMMKKFNKYPVGTWLSLMNRDSKWNKIYKNKLNSLTIKVKEV